MGSPENPTHELEGQAKRGRKRQQTYRATAAGKQKRNQQSRHYRKRVRERKPSPEEAVAEAARVIPRKMFFRWLLPPAGLP